MILEVILERVQMQVLADLVLFLLSNFPEVYQEGELMPGCGQESNLGEVLMQGSAYSVFLGVQASFLSPLRILWIRGKSYFW